MIRSSALLFLVLGPLAVPWCAADALKGRVQLTGSIVDSGCNIRVGNNNQIVSFKPLAVSGLLSGDPSVRQALTIYISDCITPEKNRSGPPVQGFMLKFEGQRHDENFGLQGDAKGIALQIKDSQGKLISPGMTLEYGALSTERLLLNYSLTLVGSGRVLEAGDYHATIKLNIQHF
ncbi:fimbrial protein [Pseudomonas sp. JR33AA]|uniref:fimbrial protein n=1 Tax=Pseudomonas sp. JR33AA TaxID=2899113 RepID=UPI001F197B29|nr:hypothetical protein [Pseudomonas sp. JR33AA]MCE5979578.1 hypothetical protein [Pseudomonas sp. JR33AA]